MPITSSISEFVKGLKSRTFKNANGIIKKIKGHELDKDYITRNGFESPILVEDKSGLDIIVPPQTFTVEDVELAVGSMRELDVIDVVKQSDLKMLMREFVEYYNNPKKSRILNVISLEFSKTTLSEMISPPRIVDELSWVGKYWPEHTGETRTFIKPEVQKYCLMSVKDSYTDFHIDFGGTSVWYHILRGQKVFYLIEPTEANLALYETWTSSANQNMIFFGDQVESCHKVVLKQGNTFFIPSGWIHGVYTPVDSLVFGGNFLHDFSITNQLKVFEIERRISTPTKFQFPNFETLCWFAAKGLVEVLKDALDGGDKPCDKILDGCEYLARHLSNWMKHKDSKISKKHKDYLPEGLAHSRVTKDLAKLTSQVKKLEPPEEKSLPIVTPESKERESLLGLKFKFNKIENSLLKFRASPVTVQQVQPETESKAEKDENEYNSEEEKLKSCYSDDTYFYPPLMDSDDEDDVKRRKKRKKPETWNPKSKVSSAPAIKSERPTREHANRLKHQMRSQSDDQESSSPEQSPIRKKKKSKRSPIDSILYDDKPSTSSQSTTIDKNKPKKGEKTAKQRLGKLLKIHKYNF